MRTLVWFRGKDLRVSDHVPLAVALASGDEIVPLFVLDPYFFAPERAREYPHRAQFLVESIASLAQNLAALGSKLFVVAGKSLEVVPALVKRWQIDRVVGQWWTEPVGRERDRRIAAAIAPVPFELQPGETLAPPDSIRTQTGTPYHVFTPFSRALPNTIAIEAPLRAPKSLPPPPALDGGDDPIPTIEALGMQRNPGLVAGGERAARDRLKAFLKGPGAHYEASRDQMGVAGTSRLSQDLKFGTLSARTAWHAVADLPVKARDKFRAELYWREFTHALLWENPALLDEPFDRRFVGFPWRDAAGSDWDAWVTGHTGYPIVDAAARELLATGYVHNRARMIAASFLTKHLLIHYKHGEAHYMKWLTDGDWAQNNCGWQWSAGCGCDAQPYFRVFNPTLQAEKFDADGAYVRRWVPEFGTAAYPKPIVEHTLARERFLAIAKDHMKP